jgi:CheY-like chemotaxis protein
MDLDSLLVCSDDRALRVLRKVLSELEIRVEQCDDPADAALRLAQRSFEAVIIDCSDEPSFGLLNKIRLGQHNRKSMSIAIIDEQTKLQSAFKLGANFVVYKPISTEKAKSSFRAARALMKRERRRSERLQVDVPGYFRFQNGEGERAIISGLSEGGISVQFSNSSAKKKIGMVACSFALPDTTTVIEANGMVAWQDSRRRVGIQFATMSDSARQSLKEWLRAQSGEKHDPPIQCTLMSISLGGCFVGTPSPFPNRTRVEMLLRAGESSIKTEGKVRLMEPELGMGIEFVSKTFKERQRLELLIRKITAGDAGVVDVLLEPEGFDWEGSSVRASDSSPETDPLLKLFGESSGLSRAEFLLKIKGDGLKTSDKSKPKTGASKPSPPRREHRITVSWPIEVWREGHDASLPQTTQLVDMSHGGARVAGLVFHLKAGEVVHLVSDGVEGRFRVIWVGDPGTAQEGQIGLQSLTALE